MHDPPQESKKQVGGSFLNLRILVADNPVFRERAGRHRLKLLPRIRLSGIETEGVR